LAERSGTLELLARQLARAVQPLQTRLAAGDVRTLLAELGMQFPPGLTGIGPFANALQNGITEAAKLPALIDQLATAVDSGNKTQIAAVGLQIIQEIGVIFSAIDTIATELKNGAGALPGMNPAEVQNFAANLAENLIEYLLLTYLEGYFPILLQVLALFGIVSIKQLDSAGPNQPAYTQKKLALDLLGDFLHSPGNTLQTLYGWGSNTFDGGLMLERLRNLLFSLSIPATFTPSPNLSLRILPFEIKPKASLSPPGLEASLQINFDDGLSLELPFLFSGWTLKLDVTGQLAGGTAIDVSPVLAISVVPPHGNISGQIKLTLTGAPPDPSQPFVLFGKLGGSRVQANSISLVVGTGFQWDPAANSAKGELLLEGKIEKGKIVISLAEADSFLTSVLPPDGFQLDFDFGVGWSDSRGIYFSGGAALEINFPLHLALGPVSLDILHLRLAAAADGLKLESSLTAHAALGPISAAVDRLGINTSLAFKRGNLGPVDLSIGFKPPNGLGIAIDAGVVAGGGFILFDPDKGQYAGVLDVSLAEIVQVKIIGVLDTILPDGSHGFSFLLIITFDFPPIQLGFGFTLNGVGGLGGVNRTMNTDALHAGFRAHTLNSVLFPPDPIANAPQIISNIENFFPPADGRYLFGPMLEIGYGTPTLITLAVGVILEVPDPVRLALLGLIDAGLPSTEAALIELHIDVLGILDFGTKTLSIDGSLYDSRVLIFSLAGDLALRLSWGENPNFLFSLGGFNPHFNTTGLNVPNMHRLTVSIGNGDNPRISANSYFAITSNSLQFGSNVEAYASAAGFTIHGYLGFDVLIIFSPFSFEFDFSAGFDVSFEGVSLCGLTVDGTFSGPRPWHLHGDASIHILFFSISASLDLTWGDSTPAILPQKPILPDLLPALQDVRNWSAALPDGASLAVTLSAPAPDDKTIRVHPLGTLSVRENIVPLDLPITRYGNATPSDGNFFSIGDVQIDGHEETKQSFQDYFAAGQFLTLSDADKVSRPSFERYDAGIKIGSSEIASGADSPRTVFYEERYIDEPAGFSRFSRRYAMLADVHLALTRQGAGFASPLKNTGLFKYGTGASGPAVATQDPGFVVAHVEDLSVRSDIVSSSGSTYFHARAALDSYLALHPEESNDLQILPVHEVAA
jgi:hypothetical protein